MRNYTEGILSDLFDMFAQKPNIKTTPTTNDIENFIDPYTMDDLFDGVVYRLKKQSRNKLTREAVNLFFPQNASKSGFEDTIDPQLIKLYKHKIEDVIIEFVTTDALDIIQQVQEFLKKKDPNYDTTTITGEQYLGSILKQVDSQKYDIIDKISKLYQEFKKEKQKKTWQIEPQEGSAKKSDASSRNLDKMGKSLNSFISVVKKNFPDLTDDQIIDNLQFLLANDKYVMKSVGSMKPGGGN